MSTAAAPSKEQLADSVVCCAEAGDIRQALARCRELNCAHPGYAYGWYLASHLMKRARNLHDALRAIDRALALGWSEQYQLHKARCVFEAGDARATAAAVETLRGRDFTDPRMHNELGTLLNYLGEHERALWHYTRAIELDAGKAEFHYNRAAVQRYLGDAEGAESGFDAALALAPEELEPYSVRAHLRTQTRERNHVAQLEAVIARTRDPEGLILLQYALAKELEDIGEYARSFASLKTGADLKRRQMQYRVETDLEIMAKIAEVYHAGMFGGRSRGFDSLDPIFVIGMPRSGTTLVERILASHSQVHAAGELNHFAVELTRLVRAGAAGAPPLSRTDFVERSAQLDFRALGAAYIGATRAKRGTKIFFIDKLPFNYLYAGLIHLALPRAKIISLQRKPMDSCYAVYKQLFKEAYPFSYDLDELGQYYVAYRALMAHWNAVLPGVIHTVHYEDLVNDFATNVHRLLGWCGLAFEEACLRFHENRTASTTASATQVRQPIYTSSVAKWRHYASELEPLRARLRAAGLATD